MTDAQLYLAIGVPLAFNALGFTLMTLYTQYSLSSLKDVWRAELKRVEEVMDARLKHMEERLG
jgi:hypothetical protein